MKIEEMEIAIMIEAKYNVNIVVPNVRWGITRVVTNSNGKPEYHSLHECDILKVTPAGIATEYEIKTSKNDFKADFKKTHKHNSNFISYFYYVVPKNLSEYVKENLPKDAGLIYLDNNKVFYAVKAPKKKSWKWRQEEMFKLAKLGTMRIKRIKEKLLKEVQRNYEINNKS
jgi:hypothetical protein